MVGLSAVDPEPSASGIPVPVPREGPRDSSDADAFRDLLQVHLGLTELKAEDFSFRHRAHRYVSRHDRFYFPVSALSDELNIQWTVTQPIYGDQ